MKKYIITAACNPYNARTHYNGERVLRYDMTTPIKWVIDDFYGEGLSLEEAMDILDSFAHQLGDDVRWMDDYNLAEDVRFFKEEENIDLDTSWYKGEGWYRDEYQVYKRGDMCLRDDVMDYAIEEMDDYKEEYAAEE